MLPLHGGGSGAGFGGGGGGGGGGRAAQVSQFLHRLADVGQMDWQAAYYQMVTIVTKPADAFKTAYYRKRTKNQWARDDPAFLVVQAAFLAAATLAYAVALGVPPGLFTYVELLFETVALGWLGAGAALASIGWWFSNKHLRAPPHEQSVEQEVEWAYCFDIHCNAFFALFLVLYPLQFGLLPLLLAGESSSGGGAAGAGAGGGSFFALILANTLWAFGAAAYFYITFLGYMSLPFLDPNGCVYFMYPIGLIVLLYLSSIGLYPIGYGFNMARVAIGYFVGA